MSRVRERKLTRQQQRAMLSFLYAGSERGFDDETTDLLVDVEWGVRPRPTMTNLADKHGLITAVAWEDHEIGYRYQLTDKGREYMRRVVALRRLHREFGLPL